MALQAYRINSRHVVDRVVEWPPQFERAVWPNDRAKMLIRVPRTFSDGAKRLAALTDRQQQVATLVCDGLSNRAIAEKLGVTEGTVKCHLHAIYQKLGIHFRTALMVALADRSKSKSV
jgi:DNA-binding NarL/FixJ family response regulator